MTFTAPMFWYHQGPRAHQLPDARSDVKGRTVLRKIRSGYAAINTPPRTPSPEPATIVLREPTPPSSPATEIDEPVVAPLVEEQEPSAVAAVAAAAAAAAALVVEAQQDDRPLTPPDYDSIEPPPYARPQPSNTLPLPPTPPGYTALPDVIAEPARDLRQPSVERRRYRDALRRRITSTRKAFRSDSSSAAGDSESGAVCEADGESARGVVLYRGEDDRWVGATERVQKGNQLLPRQRGVKAWLKRTWDRFLEWSDEHPYLFILAIFAIVVVIFCILI